MGTDPLDANITLKIEDLKTEEDVQKAAKLWRETRDRNHENKNDNDDDDGMMNGLKWGSYNAINEEHTSDNWSDNDNDDEEGNDVNMNEFKNGLTNMVSSKNDGTECMEVEM